MNKKGPGTEPWGTPWDRGTVEEVQLLMLINCYLFVRYDFSQERAVLVMLREDSRRERRMVDGVKCCSKVERDENAEVTRVRKEQEVVDDFEEGCFCALL